MSNDLFRIAGARLLIVGGLGLGAMATGSCASQDLSSAETTVAKALISPQQENQLGLQVQKQLEAQQGFKYLQDPTLNKEVQKVAEPILKIAKQQRPDVNWSIRIVDDPKTVNAFSTPGGYIYVDSGLLAAADSEAQLAGVIAHEAGHVLAYHGARQMIDQYGLQTIAAVALGQNPGVATQIASALAQKGALLAHSRADEDQADEIGVKLSAKAGYDPNGLPQFLGKLGQMEGNTPEVLQWLSDHPASRDRVAHLDQIIQQQGLRGGRVGQQEYAAIKQRMSASSPPATF